MPMAFIGLYACSPEENIPEKERLRGHGRKEGKRENGNEENTVYSGMRSSK